MAIYETEYGSVETDRANKVVKTLANDGPQRAKTIVNGRSSIMFSQRVKYNIHKCSFSIHGRDGAGVGIIHDIVYIPELHPPEVVVRAFLDVNPNVLDAGQHTITLKFNQNAKELGDAWRAISDEFLTDDDEVINDWDWVSPDTTPHADS